MASDLFKFFFLFVVVVQNFINAKLFLPSFRPLTIRASVNSNVWPFAICGM